MLVDTNLPAGGTATTRGRAGSLNTRTLPAAGVVESLGWFPVWFLFPLIVPLRVPNSSLASDASELETSIVKKQNILT